MRKFLRLAAFPVGGLGYGLILFGLGVMAARAGHGTYAIIGVSSSPFGLTRSIPIALAGAPLLWCAAGATLGWIRLRAPRAVLGGIMLVHYAALPFIVGKGSTFGDWAYARKAPGFVAVALAVYGAGQLVIWAVFVASQWGEA